MAKSKPKSKTKTKSTVHSVSSPDVGFDDRDTGINANPSSVEKVPGKRRKTVENVTPTQVVLEYNVNNRSATSRLEYDTNLDTVPHVAANEIIGMASALPQIGRHELHHSTVPEPIIVVFECRKPSSVAIVLDFADLRRTCELLAVYLDSSRADEPTTVLISRVVALAAVLRNEPYVLSGFPLTEDLQVPIENARDCLRQLCAIARGVIRALNVEEATDTVCQLKRAADDIGHHLMCLRINMRIDWT